VAIPDAASIFAATGVRFVAVRRRNVSPNTWADDYDLRLYHKRIETVYSQLGRWACNIFIRVPTMALTWKLMPVCLPSLSPPSSLTSNHGISSLLNWITANELAWF